MAVIVTREATQTGSMALKLLLLVPLVVSLLSVLPLSSATAAMTATDDFSRADGSLGRIGPT